MTRSLMTGVSGLRAHQQQLDVVANNLANMNTVGFKSQTATFSDLMYDTIRAGTSPKSNFGGTNPQQIGTGVSVSQVSRRFSQGALESTGELLDFAIQGDGYFSLSGPTGEQVYSRAGSFGLDAQGNLVDPATGYLVQRIGDVGESRADQFGFQVSGNSGITVPLGAPVPGQQTSMIEFFGNLPADASPPISEVLSSVDTFETATGPATPATRLDDLTLNVASYQFGDEINLSGTSPDGTPFSGTLSAQNATMQDLLDELNNQLDGATAELQPSGLLTITADETGEAFSSLVIEDAAGNVGGTDFLSNAMIVTTEGSVGGTYDTTMEIFDTRGNDHGIRFSFEKLTTNGWGVTAELTDDSGTLVVPDDLTLQFNEDGTFSLVTASGDGTASISVDFDTVQETQVVDLSFESMNHMATNFALSQTQDGAPPGSLVSVAVSADGEMSGLASNGKTFPLAQLAIASFSNDGGLDAIGKNYFMESANSGAASIGTGLSGRRGQVIGNQLESSNVDIAQEFTQLIVAQRGFSANARTITVASEILEEVTNLIR